MHNPFKKWPSNLWWISSNTIIKVENIIRAATFKNFFYSSKTDNYFFVTVLY